MDGHVEYGTEESGVVVNAIVAGLNLSKVRVTARPVGVAEVQCRTSV